jgi:hypothetical protein
MKHKFISEGPERTYAIVLDIGDEPVSSLTEFAKDAAARRRPLHRHRRFQRGGCRLLRLATQGLREDSDWRAGRSRFAGRRCSARSRRRAEAARPCGARQARRLGMGRASDRGARAADLEVMLVESPSHLQRRIDAATGLALIDL